MIEVGRIVVKIAGRDAGLTGVVVEATDDKFIVVDGQVRRRKCNVLHVEPLDKVVKIKKGASHDEVVKALKAEGIEVVAKKGKKESAPKPTKQRRSKKAAEEGTAEKPGKKTEKKAPKKE